MASAIPQLDRLLSIIQAQSQLSDAELDLDAFMQRVVDSVQALTDSAGAVVELVEGDAMVYRCASASFAAHAGLRLRRGGSLSGLSVAQRAILRCDDTEQDPRVDREACRRIGIRSMVCTPLFCGGEAVGVLKVMAQAPHGIDDMAVQTLELMAATLGGALGRQLAYEQRLQMAAQLHMSEARLRAMLLHANDAIVSMDAAGVVTEWNPAAERLFGWRADEALGQPLSALIIPPALRQAHDGGIARFLARGGALRASRLELPAVHRDGQPMSIELSWSGAQVGGAWEFTGFMHDISERKRLEAALSTLALQDPLTGLLNRRAFTDATDKALHHLDRHGTPAALLFLDLDGFKRLNDTRGHQAGDDALVAVAQALRGGVRKNDVVGRLGGDEFVVLADGLGDAAQARAMAQKVLQAVREAVPGSGLSCSVGIALARPRQSATELLQQADQAMYGAKQRGRGGMAMHGEAQPAGAGA
ncbi:diguanylate cyclase domain-containing protein [Azohydromonas caseinilytica]|uniref:Diguanylate cyclase n=1 Tax=Azohydromonas caseinilytica TaxID=2728836 RepID=A0A848FIE0_9BURK|nr:diguanylate cyclase [Azohydromonas caseinilytica]NML18039.1 diguanylate cyclase [Azohydromonas caseinilytica]